MRRKTGYIQHRGTSWRIAYYSADHIRQFESYKTKEEADRELAKRLADLTQGIPVSSRPNLVKFGELCDDVLTDHEVRKLKSVQDTEIRFRLHIIPAFGDRKAQSITAANLRTYVINRQAEGAKSGTITRELELIRRAFLLAKSDRKFLGECPKIPRLAENRRKGFLSREEVDRLYLQLPTPVNAFVLFGFLTGWRLEEIRGLLWSNIDFRAGEIRLDFNTKTGEPRVFPITDELRVLLETRAVARQHLAASGVKMPVARMATNTYVFSTPDGRPIGSFRKSWKTACHRAGLPCVVEPIKGKPGAVRVVKALHTFHDLRRSAAREMSNQGVPQPVIKDLMGHQTDSMFQRYRIVSAADKRLAAEIVNSHRGSIERRHGTEPGSI